MKKIYSLSLLALVGLCAYANKADLANSPAITMSQDQLKTTQEVVFSAPSDVKKAAPSKAPLAADAVQDPYLYHYISRSSGDNGGEHNDALLTIVMDGPQQGDSNNENCSIYGIWPGLGNRIRGVYDETAGTLRIYPQPLYLNTYYNENVWLYMQNASTEAVLSYIEFTYYPEGVELTYTATGEKFTVAKNGFFPQSTLDQFTVTLPSLLGTNSGWEWKYQNWFDTVEVLYPSAYVDVKGTQWDSVGNASFNDGWFKALTSNGSGYGAYNVPCYRNHNNPNMFMLENPYGTGTPYAEMNALDIPGNIVLEVITEEVENWDGDMEDMTTVAVYPFIPSGFVYTEEASGYWFYMPTFCTNLEGKYFFMFENTMEDIYYDFGDLNYTMSSVGADKKTLTLPNCRLQETGEDAIFTDQWVNSNEQPIPMETVIVLPVEVSTGAGVEGIISDASNAPVKYYNLQGVEIANPEKGQVVIKKQGNTTSKFMAR